jgi:acetyl esterase/lipase
MRLPRSVVIAGGAPFYTVGLNRRTPWRLSRRVIEAGKLVMAPLPKGTVVRHVTLAGRPAERVTAGPVEPPRAVLYLHGGGYTVGSPRLYRNLAAQLAASADAVVYNLDYRLAPEHPYPAALQDAVVAVHELVADGYPPALIAIAGDSAGGGLAVAAARLLADDGIHLRSLGLVSPWTDPMDTDSHVKQGRATNLGWSQRSARAYRATAADDDPGFAPVHGKLDGLPRMLVHTAPSEMLYRQINRFVDQARLAGADVTLVEDSRWWHSVHVGAGTWQVASDAVDDLGRFLFA